MLFSLELIASIASPRSGERSPTAEHAILVSSEADRDFDDPADVTENPELLSQKNDAMTNTPMICWRETCAVHGDHTVVCK